MMLSPRWIFAPLTLLWGSLAAAQANQVPGLDVRISNMREIDVLGREGAFPNGMNGVAIETSVCNEGTVEVPWFEAMNPDHPLIAFLVASVRDGRLVQISDRSYLKHGFFALAANGCNMSCVPPAQLGNYLGVGCSDTYGTANNGDHYYLGPPDEVDPWLGTWTRNCSLFDRGVPDVGPPGNCDGRRSFTHQQASALGPVGFRVHVSDQDLVLGGTLYYQGQYVVAGQAEAGRDDVLGSRLFDASWGGTRWDLNASGSLLHGTVLQRWPGASIASNTNGGDDGRVFVAVKVTGPFEGFYHYEYALHDRDNRRGVGALRIPKCPGARVRNPGFRDIDLDPANDWVATVGANDVQFATASSPLRWNTIFNFWFDSDAAPEAATLALDQFDPGAGLPSVDVASQGPVALYNAYLGPGCALDTPPTLYAVGTPARAALGNATFGLESRGNAPFQPNSLHYGLLAGSISFQGCTVWMGGTLASVRFASMSVSDASGLAVHPGAIPADPALEGLEFRMQAVGRDPGNGVLLANFELSEGLRVRLGNAIPGCP